MDPMFKVVGMGPLLAGKAPEIIQKDLAAAMEKALDLLIRGVKKRTPRGVSGPAGLAASIQKETVGRGTPLMKGIVGTACKYGEPVESGTKPHFPPVDPIRYWVERKLHITGKEALSVAYAIATIMARSSRLGVHMFEKTSDENEVQVRQIFEEAGLIIVRHMEGSAS